MKNTVRVAVLAAVAVVAAACSNESDGQAEPEGSLSPSAPSSAPASSEASSNLPHSGAPAVDNPLPKSALGGDVCTEALTEAQAKELLGDAVTSKSSDSSTLGPGCSWSNQSSHAGFTLNYDVNGGQGISAAYANAKPKMDQFTETDPIGGFPVVQYRDNDDDRTCTSMVGLADEYAAVMTLTIGTEGAETGQNPCEASLLVLERVVGNLKEKS
ncbi:Protein of unknown function (DUF3558) [Prauserella aidingensis]|uniref:DUF3558 domain-containing protein n=1 Tax=Prauserella aidingensis TaxID=387890 RepID=UPI0020A5A6E7|nr:DUF3558 domain-containing protein [Prauserella aidingensis]MCP2256292.1 Protein of unknown function (DUF3558) [Prauserella aidingensis]